jgi:uncharacterized protein
MPPRFAIDFRSYRVFEWDAAKSDQCFAERGFDFGFASQVFQREILRRRDTRIRAEDRYQIIGDAGGAILFVVYVMRDQKCRIISARPATQDEARLYDER